MSLGVVASVVGIAGGVTSIAKSFSGGGGGTSGGPSSPPQQAADPFAPYRSGEASTYANYMAPGGTVDPTQMPGYSQFISGVLNPAMGSVEASAGASGRAFSGQEATDLTKTATQSYYGFMQNYLTQLAQGSGAINNPAPAAQLGYGVANQNQQGIMQGVGGIMQGVQGVYNGMNGPSGYMSSDPSGSQAATMDPTQANTDAYTGNYSYGPSGGGSPPGMPVG